MARTLRRPMFRIGGMAQREKYMGGGIKTIRPKYMGGGMTGIMSGIRPDAGLTPRTGYADGPSLQEIIAAQELKDPSTIIYDKDYIQKLLDQKTRKLYEPGLPGYGQQIATPDTPTQRGIKEYLETNPEGAYELFKTGKLPGFGDTDYGALQAAQAEKAKKAGIDLGLGVASDDKPKITNIPPPPKKEDPEKSLMDVYGENKGIIDQVMGSADEDTKKSMYLQLAKFGAGLLAEPGGDLVGAVGKAAAKPLEGVEATLAEKRKGDREAKLMALSKTFEDMKQPEQVKLIKQIQKEFGFDTFKEAYDYINKPKVNPALKLAESKALMDFAKERGISETGFLKEMDKLEDAGLGDLIGQFTRQDIEILPTDIDDRVNGEYYIRDNGKPVRIVDGIIYVPEDPEFIAKIETKET